MWWGGFARFYLISIEGYGMSYYSFCIFYAFTSHATRWTVIRFPCHFLGQTRGRVHGTALWVTLLRARWGLRPFSNMVVSIWNLYYTIISSWQNYAILVVSRKFFHDQVFLCFCLGLIDWLEATEATGPGFVFFLLLSSLVCVLSANRVDFGLFVSEISHFQFYPPPPQISHRGGNTSERSTMSDDKERAVKFNAKNKKSKIKVRGGIEIQESKWGVGGWNPRI